MPILVIKIANTLKPLLKLEKEYMLLLVMALISIILYGINLIPFVVIIFSLLIKITAIGLVVNVFLPHKELSEEEKKVLEETKKLAKENKEKAKLEAKALKKEKIAKTKTDKKQEKTKNKETKTKSKEKKKKDKNN